MTNYLLEGFYHGKLKVAQKKLSEAQELLNKHLTKKAQPLLKEASAALSSVLLMVKEIETEAPTTETNAATGDPLNEIFGKPEFTPEQEALFGTPDTKERDMESVFGKRDDARDSKLY